MKNEVKKNPAFTPLVRGIIGIVIAVVVYVAVAIPISLQVVASSGATGITLLLLNLIPVGLAIAAFVTSLAFI